MPLPTELDAYLRSIQDELPQLTIDWVLQLEAYLQAPDRLVTSMSDLQREHERGIRNTQDKREAHIRWHRYLRRVLHYNKELMTQSSVTIHDKQQIPSTTTRPVAATWTEVGLGVDGTSVLFFSPVPPIGSRVSKSWGLPIQLSGQRWSVLLNLASSSADYEWISTKQFCEQAVKGSRSKEADPGKWLRDTLSDLRRKLKSVIDVVDDSQGCLIDEGEKIRLVITVRGLLADETRHYRFG